MNYLYNFKILHFVQDETVDFFNGLNFKIGDSGTELEDAFREVGRKLKEDLLTKVNWKG